MRASGWSEVTMSGEAAESIAVVVYREDGAWQSGVLPERVGGDLDGLIQVLRQQPAEHIAQIRTAHRGIHPANHADRHAGRFLDLDFDQANVIESAFDIGTSLLAHGRMLLGRIRLRWSGRSRRDGLALIKAASTED